MDPPVTLIGGDAKMPEKNLNTRKAAQFGARAVAMVKMMQRQSVERRMGLRPYCSLRGANTSGPSTNPTRYVVAGSIV